MSCKCIIQSGPNKDSQCGRAIKIGKTCGVHKNKCVLPLPAPIRKQAKVKMSPERTIRSPVDRAIVKFVLEIDPDLLRGDVIRTFLKENFPGEKMSRARKELAQKVFEEKMKRLESKDCTKCLIKHEKLRI